MGNLLKNIGGAIEAGRGPAPQAGEQEVEMAPAVRARFGSFSQADEGSDAGPTETPIATSLNEPARIATIPTQPKREPKGAALVRFLIPILQGAGDAAMVPQQPGQSNIAHAFAGFGAAGQGRERRDVMEQQKQAQQSLISQREAATKSAEERIGLEREKFERQKELQEGLLSLAGPGGITEGANFDADEMRSVRAAAATGDPKQLRIALDSIRNRRAITANLKDERGDIVPDEKSPTGFSRPIRDRQGNVLRNDPVLPPPGFRYQISTGEQVIVDDQGQIHKVQTTRTTQPAAIGGKSAPRVAAPSGQSAVPPARGASQASASEQAAPQAAQPKEYELTTSYKNEKGEEVGWNPAAIAEVDSPQIGQIRQQAIRAAVSTTGIRKLPASAKAKLDLLATIRADIEVVEKLSPQHKDFFGPLAGPATRARIKQFGTTDDSTLAGGLLGELGVQAGVPPEVIDLFAVMLSLQDSELRARSGAQINEQEMKRLIEFLPDPNLPASVNAQRVKQFKRRVDEMIQQITGKRPAASIDFQPN